MSGFRRWSPPLFVLLLATLLAAPGAGASDRLFLAFPVEAATVQNQWWEGQAEWVDEGPVDLRVARLVLALQPWRNVEFGGRVGFGSSDAPTPIPDGSGATDLDLWGKFLIRGASTSTTFALGALATVPTGDDTAGLGNDGFDFQFFGSMRQSLDRVVVSAHAAVRQNGNGRRFGVDLNGKTSFQMGAGVLYPVSDRVSLIAETTLESKRYERGDADFRVLGGLNFKPGNRGLLRAALALGATDGAPDAQLIFGYAYTF